MTLCVRIRFLSRYVVFWVVSSAGGLGMDALVRGKCTNRVGMRKISEVSFFFKTTAECGGNDNGVDVHGVNVLSFFVCMK